MIKKVERGTRFDSFLCKPIRNKDEFKQVELKLLLLKGLATNENILLKEKL